MICPGCGLELDTLSEHLRRAHGGLSEDVLGQRHPEAVPDMPELVEEKGLISIVRERQGPYL